MAVPPFFNLASSFFRALTWKDNGMIQELMCANIRKIVVVLCEVVAVVFVFEVVVIVVSGSSGSSLIKVIEAKTNMTQADLPKLLAYSTHKLVVVVVVVPYR